MLPEQYKPVITFTSLKHIIYTHGIPTPIIKCALALDLWLALVTSTVWYKQHLFCRSYFTCCETDNVSSNFYPRESTCFHSAYSHPRHLPTDWHYAHSHPRSPFSISFEPHRPRLPVSSSLIQRAPVRRLRTFQVRKQQPWMSPRRPSNRDCFHVIPSAWILGIIVHKCSQDHSLPTPFRACDGY